MNVVLISPPSPFLIDQKAFPPLGLLYLAAYLERYNVPVTVADMANQEDRIEEALAPYSGADLYGITATTPQYPQAIHILNILRRQNPDAKIIIGGAHASSLPENCAQEGFDHVVVGEGETTLLDLCQKKVECCIIKSYPVYDMGVLPWPARHMIDIKSYAYEIDGRRGTTMITSRGCPFSCAFCSKDVWQGNPRFHSISYVISELEAIINNYGFKHFLFLDDSIALHKTRLIELCRQIEPLGIKWRCYARATTTKAMLQAMKNAGCIEIGVGIESGSQEILNKVSKGVTVEQNTKFIELCKEVGIIANVFIMIGLPGETRETVEETRQWMERARPEKFGFNIFMPYAGTPIYRDPEKYGMKILELATEGSWVKGRQGEYNVSVETNELSRQDILSLFYECFTYYTELSKWKPGIGKVVQNDKVFSVTG